MSDDIPRWDWEKTPKFDKRAANVGKEKGIPFRIQITALSIACIVGGVYFAIVRPAMNADKWRELQSKNRAAIDPANLNPSDLTPWTSPWTKKDSTKDK